MDLSSQIEAILFIAGRAMSVKRLAKILEADEKAVEAAADQLAQSYQARQGGLTLVSHEGELQFVTSAESAELVQKFLKDETTGELTKPALETLTIIAYRGPVSKADVERIRGVNCSMILRNLMMRGLVQIEEDKKRLLSFYTVSIAFLRHLGLTSVKELPDYGKLHQTETLEQFLAQAKEVAAETPVTLVE